MDQLAFSLRPVRDFFARYHLVLFISCTMLLLAAAIFVLYTILSSSTEGTDANQTTTIGNFDQATINKIKNLHDSSDSSDNVVLPSPRPNPFVE